MVSVKVHKGAEVGLDEHQLVDGSVLLAQQRPLVVPVHQVVAVQGLAVGLVTQTRVGCRQVGGQAASGEPGGRLDAAWARWTSST